MIPDYSFELFFKAGAGPAVAEALAPSASPDCREALMQAIELGAGSANLMLIVNPADDAAVRRWDELSHIDPSSPIDPAGEVWIGWIDVHVKVHDRVPYDDQYQTACLNLRLWPLTRLMQETFLNSPTLRAWLVELLSSCSGLVGYISRGDGSLAEFWPHDRAPAGYEYELVRQL